MKKTKTQKETNLISCAEIILIVIDPNAAGDIRTLLLNGHHQGHGFIVETCEPKRDKTTQ